MRSSHRLRGAVSARRKTPRPARVAIRNHRDFFHLAMGPKLGLQRVLRRREGQVANIQLHRTKLQNSYSQFQAECSGLGEAMVVVPPSTATGLKAAKQTSAIVLESYKATRLIAKGNNPTE